MSMCHNFHFKEGDTLIQNMVHSFSFGDHVLFHTIGSVKNIYFFINLIIISSFVHTANILPLVSNVVL